MENSYQEFISRLKKLYGAFDEAHKKFEKAPNAVISRDLGYSDAQFSRLINESATDGEYARANQNAERILTLISLEEKVKRLAPRHSGKKRIVAGLILTLVSFLLGYGVGGFNKKEQSIETPLKYDMLRWSFETEFINSYSKLKDLPQSCEFPCYKYQGKWELNKAYKLPFFRERSGFHYVATEVHMYARCMPEKSATGNILEGYEYQKHEIWYDMRELPVDSFLVDNGIDLNEKYRMLDFKQDKNFVRLAYVHTFFRNEFNINSTEVGRVGKVIGRDIEFINEDELIKTLKDSKTIKKVQKEVDQIILNRLEDFSRPIACGLAKVPAADFNEIKDGDQLDFNCQLTTGRVSINYTKSYALVDQYIKNRCRP